VPGGRLGRPVGESGRQDQTPRDVAGTQPVQGGIDLGQRQGRRHRRAELAGDGKVHGGDELGVGVADGGDDPLLGDDQRQR